jgi:hypothetical protein
MKAGSRELQYNSSGGGDETDSRPLLFDTEHPSSAGRKSFRYRKVFRKISRWQCSEELHDKNI